MCWPGTNSNVMRTSAWLPRSNTLEAVVDREGPGLEWEAKDRHLALGAADGPDAVCWLVRDGSGRRVDGSANAEDRLGDALFTFQALDDALREVDRGGATWRVAQRRVEDAPGVGKNLPEDRYAELTLTAAIPLTPLHALLRNLARGAGGSIAGGVGAGRGSADGCCAAALLPVTRMAAARVASMPRAAGATAASRRRHWRRAGGPGAGRSTTCWVGSKSHSSGSGASRGTPRNSCARRWRPCSARSRSPYAARGSLQEYEPRPGSGPRPVGSPETDR